MSNFSDQTKKELLHLLEEYPELKASLQRYETILMKKYTVIELMEKRSANRKIASFN